jgi:hypothetical protein
MRKRGRHMPAQWWRYWWCGGRISWSANRCGPVDTSDLVGRLRQPMRSTCIYSLVSGHMGARAYLLHHMNTAVPSRGLQHSSVHSRITEKTLTGQFQSPSSTCFDTGLSGRALKTTPPPPPPPPPLFPLLPPDDELAAAPPLDLLAGFPLEEVDFDSFSGPFPFGFNDFPACATHIQPNLRVKLPSVRALAPRGGGELGSVQTGSFTTETKRSCFQRMSRTLASFSASTAAFAAARTSVPSLMAFILAFSSSIDPLPPPAFPLSREQ